MKRRILTLTVTLLSFFGGIRSQSIAIGEIFVDSLQWAATADSAWVTLQMDLSQLSLRSNREVELSPYFVADGERLLLEPIKIMGRRRYLYDLRNQEADGLSQRAQRIRWRKGKPQLVDYHAAVRWSTFPEELQLGIDVIGMGCRCLASEPSRYLLAKRNYRSVFQPWLAYVAPPVEGEKQRVEKGSAYVVFRVGSHEVLPRYRDNAQELARMGQRIRAIAADDDVVLRRISITGYASPEGNFQSNQQLAQRRTQALIDYLKEAYAIETDKIVVGFGSEDWKVLRDYVAVGEMEKREEILALIDGAGGWDEKERQLRQHYPHAYMDLRKICFPKLRRTDYEIYYALRAFSPEEARKVIFTTPQKLSLNEMYAAAQTFSRGSREFYEALEVAVKMYPADTIANLNAGQAALEQRHLLAAERYLAKAGTGGEALMARGVLAYWLQDEDRALRLLRQASQRGVKAAEKNLEMIEKRTRR